jgi:hypothetical protein
MGTGAHPASNRHGGSFVGVKQPGRETDHSASRAEVKNEWSYTCAPSVCVYGVDSDTFNLLKPSGNFKYCQV